MINVDMINGESHEIVDAVPAAPKVKMAIKNVSALSDEALLAKLLKHGVDVSPDATRGAMLVLARGAGLWAYAGNIIPKGKKVLYAANGGNCGDDIAKAFGPMTDTPECDAVLKGVAEANEIDYSRWAHLNFGQRRMNLSNVLRGKIKRGEYVIINTTEFNYVEDEAAEI